MIIQVGGAIGVWPTLAILLIDGFLGAALARSQGRTAWRRFNEATAAGRIPAKEVFDGAAIIVGGAFLLAPGFITDAIGLSLLIPPTRALYRRILVGGARRVGPAAPDHVLLRPPRLGPGGGPRPGPPPRRTRSRARLRRRGQRSRDPRGPERARAGREARRRLSRGPLLLSFVGGERGYCALLAGRERRRGACSSDGGCVPRRRGRRRSSRAAPSSPPTTARSSCAGAPRGRCSSSAWARRACAPTRSPAPRQRRGRTLRAAPGSPGSCRRAGSPRSGRSGPHGEKGDLLLLVAVRAEGAGVARGGGDRRRAAHSRRRAVRLRRAAALDRVRRRRARTRAPRSSSGRARRSTCPSAAPGCGSAAARSTAPSAGSRRRGSRGASTGTPAIGAYEILTP